MLKIKLIDQKSLTSLFYLHNPRSWLPSLRKSMPYPQTMSYLKSPSSIYPLERKSFPLPDLLSFEKLP